MPSKHRRQCAECGRIAAQRSRFCSTHQARYRRYGHPTQVPVIYRNVVAPKWHQYILDGYKRLTDNPGMIAGRELAQRCLSFTYESDPTVARVAAWASAAHAMRLLKEHRVTVEQLMLRYAEMVAAIDAEPWRVKGQVAEQMAIGRAVLHLAKWKAGRQPGKQLILATADHVRQHLGKWAVAFLKRLKDDDMLLQQTLKRSMDFGPAELP